eukprot:TRINITY_DN5217_c0_g1_i3.p1 TRINITY_DN5217_c0_g1~~TRINITY_DN5217_c0_g1_i3.p1  ORF type:complete len:135 (+),score=14.09 TRINITY_DN5217_c0_g1_i3:290-694(+)
MNIQFQCTNCSSRRNVAYLGNLVLNRSNGQLEINEKCCQCEENMQIFLKKENSILKRERGFFSLSQLSSKNALIQKITELKFHLFCNQCKKKDILQIQSEDSNSLIQHLCKNQNCHNVITYQMRFPIQCQIVIC